MSLAWSYEICHPAVLGIKTGQFARYLITQTGHQVQQSVDDEEFFKTSELVSIKVMSILFLSRILHLITDLTEI